MKNSRREFIRKSAIAGTAVFTGATGFSAQSYRHIFGANDRVRVGVVGFSDRHKDAHIPSFVNLEKN